MKTSIYETMNMHFNVGVAKTVGVDGAIMLNNLQYWVVKNMAEKRHYHDGRYWTYNTLEAFTDLFPFWSKRQIERILNNLKNDDYIMTGNFNKVAYDRTRWYTLTDKCWLLMSPNCDMSKINISPNGEMENTKWGNGSHETVTPIPNHKPDHKPNNNCSSCDELWKLYPRKHGKAIAYKKIPNLIKEYGYEQIERCIKRYDEEVKKMNIEKKFIKYGSTFFTSGYVDYLDENYITEENTDKTNRPGRVIELNIG